MSKMITSKQNNLIKTIRSLKDKKYRDKEGLYVVEGVKMVKEALIARVEICDIICTPNGAELLIATFGALPQKTQTVTQIVYDSITNEVSPQGVLAVCVKPSNNIEKPNNSCLLIDGAQDPANVGAIIRCAAAAGYNQVYLADCADAYSPKAVRASMSGIFKVNVMYGSREELVEVIDKPIIIADMNGQNVFEVKLQNEFCLVIGNEGHGVSSLVKEKATLTVSIPMQNGMESLNAGVSAGILMYALKN